MDQVSPRLGQPYQLVYARDSGTDRFKPIGTTMPPHGDRPLSSPSFDDLVVSLALLAMPGSTPLHQDAYTNNLAAARSALAAGGDVDAPNHWGFTALQMRLNVTRHIHALPGTG